MQAVSLSLVVIALIKLFKVPFSCALRSLRTIKYFQPTVFEPEVFIFSPEGGPEVDRKLS